MKKQALTLAIAAALSAPSALAAQDDGGMRYTSASEGFYASIRAGWFSGKEDFKDGGADVGGVVSRFGVRGSNDLGGGMEGFYQYEAGINHNQGSHAGTRLAHVGVRGAFGEIVAGTFWNNLYGFSYSATDVALNYSGWNLSSGNSGTDPKPLPNRINHAVQYTTPNLNGFQGAVLAVSDNSGTADSDPDTDGKQRRKDDNNLDSWGLAAKYDIQGFSMGASWWNNADAVSPIGVGSGADSAQTALQAFDGSDAGTAADHPNGTVTAGTGTDDQVTWTLKLGYSQDNWYVNGWYGQTNAGDAKGFTVDRNGDAAANPDGDRTTVKFDDTKYMSFAAGVDIDKVSLYGVYDSSESDARSGFGKKSNTDTYVTLGAQYKMGAQSRVIVEYFKPDVDSSEDEDDVFMVALRHDF